MSIIKILPAHEAQKIAAGEVIERPAHILKELIENSIDAGATQIFIWIEQAGKQLIRIVDNGCGMNEQDAHTCFLPHATSKISSLEDLYCVQSYGFRGEALASIAAVSKVTLVTRLKDDPTGIGTFLQYQDGSAIEHKAVSCPIGTELVIRDLFYNIPVRKKFLKADSTEWSQIQAIIQAFCLSHLDIHFKLFHDDRLVLNAPAVPLLKDRVAQIWDYDVAQNLISLEKSKKQIPWFSYDGLISKHQFWKHGRTHIFFFVNGRWIKNQELSKALLKGYLNVLPPAKFPAAFVFLQVDQDQVDVNVHPKKEEVRFVKPATVESQLFDAVKMTLEVNLNRTLSSQNSDIQEKPTIFSSSTSLSAPHQAASINTFSPQVHRKPSVDWDMLLNMSAFKQDSAPAQQPSHGLKLHGPQALEASEKYEKNEQHEQQNLLVNDQKDETLVVSFSIIGQLFKTYIIIESGDQLIMVDQHAAHERVLYEKFLKNFQHKEGTALLFPEIVHVSAHQMEIAQGLLDFFNDQGIILELFGASEIAIKSSPPLIAQHDLKDLLFEAIHFVEEHNTELDTVVFAKKLNEFTHSHMACKAAVKAGDSLEQIFMHQLMSDLMSVENRFICVHGRPTMWTMQQSVIEKNFRRR